MGWVVTNNIEKVFDRLISNYWHLLDELYVLFKCCYYSSKP